MVGVVTEKLAIEKEARKSIMETAFPPKKDAIFIMIVAVMVDNDADMINAIPAGRTRNPIRGMMRTFETRVTVDILLK